MSIVFSFAGIQISAAREGELSKVIDDFLQTTTPHQIVTVNSEILVEAHRNLPYRTLLQNIDCTTVDSAGPIFMARLFGHAVSLRDRVTGSALTRMLLQRAEDRGLRVACILRSSGLTNEEQLHRALREQYPRLEVSIFDEYVVSENLRHADPVMLLVGLGAPRQEFWIAERLGSLDSLRIAVGIGGTFDFISGRIKRAPRWMQRSGIEWVWRFFRQPQRLLRIIRAVVVFPLIALRSR